MAGNCADSVDMAQGQQGREYPSAQELLELKKKSDAGEPLNCDRIKQMMKGLFCWKCFEYGASFSCAECGRPFHRKCAFIKGGFGHPYPIFDKPMEEAMTGKLGTVNMIKCAICQLSEETYLLHLRNVSRDDLNELLWRMTKYILDQKAGNLLDVYTNKTPEEMSTSKILDKTKSNLYNSVEGYYADFRLIFYNIHKKYRSDEATEVVTTILQAVHSEIETLSACWQCKLRNFDQKGKLLNLKEYAKVINVSCEVPHLVIWEKEGTFPQWPAKLLGHDSIRKRVYIQCFGTKAGARSIEFPGGPISFKIYSKKYPGKEPSTDIWKKARKQCEEYLANLRLKFGTEAVVIQDEAEATPLDDDVDWDVALRNMYPTVNLNGS